ncbi:hypothetical protein TKWG_20455 [Advenella kashmirensis WT001]|uniref:Uncharacterized protein n=1 Tax=Advenella kashmirensis (strain DSM 17095 / LMG 22695 / WT001) TaxID=1036672 RepID=I3UFQ2_ADVKW|nr:hypothetical protein TKWG_20455 [Advenella kashmirensis WT001]
MGFFLSACQGAGQQGVSAVACPGARVIGSAVDVRRGVAMDLPVGAHPGIDFALKEPARQQPKFVIM